MDAVTRPRVKICCIATVSEARLAIREGASAVGLVSAMPSGPGVIEEARIAAIARTIPPGVATFLLTALTDPDAIVEQQRRTRAGVVQLVDRVDVAGYAVLRRLLPGIGLVQVIHVSGHESVDEAKAIAPHVDALLLDSGNPTLPLKELGGTGRVHNWDVSRSIRESIHIPVYLAGGLRPDNVVAAIDSVRPFGVDLCTGIRTNGKLDPHKLTSFMHAVANIPQRKGYD